MIPNPHGANHIARGAQAYFTDPGATVWHRVGATRNDVQDRSGRTTVFSKADALKQQHDGKRVDGAKSKQSTFGSSNVTYACEHRSDATFVTADQANAHRRVGVDPRLLYGSYVVGNLHRIKEKEWSTKYFGTGDWTTETTLTGNDQWNSSTGGDPRGDVRTAKATIRQLLGGKVDGVRYLGVTSGAGFDTLKTHPGLDNIGGLQARAPRDAQIAEVANWLSLDDIVVGNASENTGPLGGTAAYADLLADNFLVCVAPQNAMDVMQPTSMLTVITSEGLMSPVFSEVPQTLKGSFHVEVDIDSDFVQVDADLGYLIIDVNA
jgi:hypothetical protein